MLAKISRLPGPEQISGPASMSPGGPMAVEDKSGLIQGISDLAQGVRQLSGDLSAVDKEQKRKQNVVDLSRAETEWLKRTIKLENDLVEDPNYQEHEGRAGTELETIRQEIASGIRDDELRERWLADNENNKLRFINGVHDRSRALQNQDDRVSFGNSLLDSAALISEPSTDEAIRKKARSDIEANLQLALDSNLITQAEADDYRRKVLDAAESQLAANRAALDIMADPNGAKTRFGISQAMGTEDVSASAAQVSGGIVQLDPGVAQLAAEQLQDGALPSDPALRKAYLADPKMNAQYAQAAMDMLTERYDGDIEAAVIASKGGTALADAWVKNKNDAILPADVRKYYRDVVAGMTSVADMASLPVIAGPGVDLANMDVAVLDRYEKLQGAFGEQLTIISGYRDPAHNADVGGAKRSQHMDRRAIDIDVSKLSKEERVRFLEMASAAGFTGIGVYDNSVHLDTGNRRAWGPDHHNESIPGWAREVMDAHTSGKITSAPPTVKGVAPEYQALTFDQRMTLYRQAQAEADRQGLDMQAGIEVAVQNAPAAIMQSGGYSGEMPTVEDFVQAYGAAEGVQRFKAFDANVDVAEAAFGMRTMSAEEIAQVVQSAIPTSTGDEAAVQGERFDAISKAADQILEQREKDPAAYVMSAYPEVAKAFDLSGANADGTAPTEQDKAERYTRALTMMSTAQAQLGIESPVLLPKSMADQAAATFNDQNLTQPQRMGALTQLVLGTQDEGQQQAIMDQLVKSGIPAETEAALAALVRGDSGAAAYLFRASMTDIDKLPLPPNVQPKTISDTIYDAVLSEGEIGDVVYGLTDGTAENFDRAIQDMNLFNKAVRLRLADGTAATPEQAIALTTKDMYGDVKVDRTRNVKITLPSDEDPAPLRKGFNALLPQVRDALSAQLTPAIAGASTNDGQAQILSASRDNYIDIAIDEGYFTNSGDGYVYIDPRTGAYVPDINGGPLTFTREDVLQAGATAPSGFSWPMIP